MHHGKSLVACILFLHRNYGAQGRKWRRSAEIVRSCTRSEHLRCTTGRDKAARLHLRWALRGPYASWQVPRCLHIAPAPRLWCSWPIIWLNSAGIACSCTASEHLRCTIGRDKGARLHFRWALRDPYVSWQVPRCLHIAPAPRLWCSGPRMRLNSAEIARSSTRSDRLSCSTGGDQGA